MPPTMQCESPGTIPPYHEALAGHIWTPTFTGNDGKHYTGPLPDGWTLTGQQWKGKELLKDKHLWQWVKVNFL